MDIWKIEDLGYVVVGIRYWKVCRRDLRLDGVCGV